MAELFKFFLMLFLVNLITTNVISQTSPRIKTQSNLKDADGIAAPDGTYAMIFNLYHDESFGNSIWTESANVTVKGGIYSHLLGSIVPLDDVDFTKKVFLGITIGGYELSPRTELTYAPYAVASYGVVCSGAVGDVKYSILDPTLFAQVNGDCWVPLDGGSMANSRLNNITGAASVPDISGLFIRSQEYSGGVDNDPNRTSTSAIATFQDHGYSSHSHGVNDPGHSHPFGDIRHGNRGQVCGCLGQAEAASKATQNDYNGTTLDLTDISIANSGGSETRPTNLNVWMYMRIN